MPYRRRGMGDDTVTVPSTAAFPDPLGILSGPSYSLPSGSQGPVPSVADVLMNPQAYSTTVGGTATPATPTTTSTSSLGTVLLWAALGLGGVLLLKGFK